jgi:hypothetical protein
MGTAISAAAGAVAAALGGHETASSEDLQPAHTHGVNSYVLPGSPALMTLKSDLSRPGSRLGPMTSDQALAALPTDGMAPSWVRQPPINAPDIALARQPQVSRR